MNWNPRQLLARILARHRPNGHTRPHLCKHTLQPVLHRGTAPHRHWTCRHFTASPVSSVAAQGTTICEAEACGREKTHALESLALPRRELVASLREQALPEQALMGRCRRQIGQIHSHWGPTVSSPEVPMRSGE